MRVSPILIAVIAGATSGLLAEEPVRSPGFIAREPAPVRQAAHLPTNQATPEALVGESSPEPPGEPGPDLAKLMLPSIRLGTEWQAEASGVQIASYDARLKVPTYPIFGPPPPFVNGDFSYTRLSAPASLELPVDLYEYSLGLSWVRRLSERWTLRTMCSAALASDMENLSSDAWQFRGGVFAMYRPNEELTWLLGALALGINDLPVVPAAGAIWQPDPRLRFDLLLPKPRVSALLVDNGSRQQWVYFGGGFSGGTWAYEQPRAIDDQLTYRDWRIVIGWESTPTPEPGMPFTRGRKLSAEFGYLFGRKFKFDSFRPDIRLDNTLMLQAMASF